MTVTIPSLRCSLQVALLGAVTDNLRGVSVEFNKQNIQLFFYYEDEPSEDEIETSEIVASEVISDFLNASVDVHRIISPRTTKLPETGFKVFHRKE